MRPSNPFVFAVTTVALSLGVKAAAAQECGDDQPCPAGFTCEASPGVCPTKACADGDDCEAVACDPIEQHYCVAKTCDPDGASDQCGELMLCTSYTHRDCKGSSAGCANGDDCDVASIETDCTDTTTSTCAYKHELPCDNDSDCGAGFDCEYREEMSCRGGGSTGGSAGSADSDSAGSDSFAPAEATADAGIEPAPSDPECTTTRSEEKWCAPREIDCDEVADCPEAWTCEDYYDDDAVSSACTDPAIAPDGGVEELAPDCIEMTPTPAGKHCVAPDSYSGRGDAEDLGTPTSAAGENEIDEDKSTDDGSDVVKNPQSSAGSTDSDGGCSINQRSSKPASFAWLALGALALFARRRR